MSEILIKDGFIATMSEDKRIIQKGSLYIEDGVIVDIGKKVQTPRNPEIIIEAKHKVIMPGFVNVHSHLQQYFRGVYELMGDFYNTNLPLEGYRRPEDMDWLGDASCAEFIHGGCTTSMVIYTYPDGFAKSVEKAGQRVILGSDIEEVDLQKLKKGVYEYLPDKGEATFTRAVDTHRKWHGKNGLITTVMAPKAADLAVSETYLKCKDYAEENGLRMTTHLSQSIRECKQVEKLYSKTSPEHLRDLGVLNDNLTGAHCTYANEKDTQLIADSGMGILHCRSTSNPLMDWIDRDIPVGLGTDDYYHDMNQLIRENITGQRRRARAVGGAFSMIASSKMTVRPSYYDLLELATRKSAEVLGIGDKVGCLEKGKKADIITYDMLNPYLTPTRDPLTSIVLYSNPSDIDYVIVEGKILKENGELTTIDRKKSLLTAQKRTDEIIDRFFEDHPNQRESWEKMVKKGQ